MPAVEAAIAAYLAPRLAAPSVEISGLSRIPGGASRETWMFDAAWESGGSPQSQAFILRKDPPASLLDTDRELEYAFYSAFLGTSVPVPRMRWLEPDASILGGPFFVMERILDCQANTRLLQEQPYRDLQPQFAARMYEILGAIASFDWRGTAIETVCKPPAAESTWDVELSHWERVINEEELSPQPVIRAAIRWLRGNPPKPAQRISVVHGDYRVGNWLYRPDGGIYGVLDWEMAHLGDPLEDLAWSFNESWQWARDGRPGGIVTKDEAVRLWKEASGLDVDAHSLH